MEAFIRKDYTYVIRPWEERWDQISAGFTGREGGVSKTPYVSLNMGFHVGDKPEDVCRNRNIVSKSIGFPLHHWIGSEQVHGAVIKKVGSQDAGKGSNSLETAIPGTDGIYTNEPGVLLTSLYADCVPLYFWAPEHAIVGLAHAGWKGTVQSIGPSMIKKWTEKEGITKENIYVCIGPSIGSCCYEVDEKVISQLKNALGSQAENAYVSSGTGKYQLNLREANRLLLLKAGINEDHILTTEYCTSCQSELFFSYRKENGNTGRMMSYIGIRKGDI